MRSATAPRILKSKRPWDRVLYVCVILAGVALFMCSSTDATSAQGNLIALSEGIFFTGLTLGAKKAAGTNSVGLTGIANAFTAVVVFLLFPQAGAALPTLTGQDWFVMLILGVVQVGGGYAFYTLGVQRTTPRRRPSSPCGR